MKAKKIKTYVLTISEYFPKTHNRSGQPTNFFKSIDHQIKLHTIRGNYPLWKKRIEEVQAGNAVLSIRRWTGKPYKSPQEEVYQIDKYSGIGVQELIFYQADIITPAVNGNVLSILELSENDGLIWVDFKEWFKNYDLSEPMAIIHFTSFRY